MQRQSREPLVFFKVFLPRFSEIYAEDPDPTADFTACMQAIRRVTLFDCRALPVDFIIDTGRNSDRESSQLPFESCYFEFADARGVVVWQPPIDMLQRNLPPLEFTAMDCRWCDDGSGDYEFRCPAIGGMTGLLNLGKFYVSTPGES